MVIAIAILYIVVVLLIKFVQIVLSCGSYVQINRVEEQEVLFRYS